MLQLRPSTRLLEAEDQSSIPACVEDLRPPCAVCQVASFVEDEEHPCSVPMAVPMAMPVAASKINPHNSIIQTKQELLAHIGSPV
mmetsp:Transcript_75398/g.149125  ORF Transcript_75398/g.149125 Transcript_75398/m.149125 type:complete len:85 (+) Transcript_75398:802-1056(+)